MTFAAALLLGWVSALHLCAWGCRFLVCAGRKAAVLLYFHLFRFFFFFVSGFLLTLDLMHFQREAAFLTPDVKSSGHCSTVTWEGLVV